MKKIMFNDRYGLTSAVLRGCKTMTRRIIPEIIPDSAVITAVYDLSDDSVTYFAHDEEAPHRGDGSAEWTKLVPKYKVGEVVAVAQALKDVLPKYSSSVSPLDPAYNNKMFVRAAAMPHQIRITGIQVKRLQDINDENCIKEGVSLCEICKRYTILDCNDKHCFETPRKAFAALIDKVSGKGTWDSNPWVFVYEFELIR